jgi:hypothetical protein
MLIENWFRALVIGDPCTPLIAGIPLGCALPTYPGNGDRGVANHNGMVKRCNGEAISAAKFLRFLYGIRNELNDYRKLNHTGDRSGDCNLRPTYLR